MGDDGDVDVVRVQVRRESAHQRKTSGRVGSSISSVRTERPDILRATTWRDATPRPPKQLAHLFRRSGERFTRATRAAQDIPAVESHVDVLRALLAFGPLSSASLAAELRLARPTVSNLLKEMVPAGLVQRRSDPADGRAVIVEVTARGRQGMETFRDDRAVVIARALDELPGTERAAVIAALPALRSMAEIFDEYSRQG